MTENKKEGKKGREMKERYKKEEKECEHEREGKINIIRKTKKRERQRERECQRLPKLQQFCYFKVGLLQVISLGKHSQYCNQSLPPLSGGQGCVLGSISSQKGQGMRPLIRFLVRRGQFCNLGSGPSQRGP